MNNQKKRMKKNNNDCFRKHLEESRKKVQSWPKWKQTVLGYKNSSLALDDSKKNSSKF